MEPVSARACHPEGAELGFIPPGSLGDFLFTLDASDNHSNVDSSATEHVDKGVNAEESVL